MIIKFKRNYNIINAKENDNLLKLLKIRNENKQ